MKARARPLFDLIVMRIKSFLPQPALPAAGILRCKISRRDFAFIGLLRLQQIYQGLQPGNDSIQVESVKRLQNVSDAITFLHTIEELSRYKTQF
jgi:hypothetical protein